MNLLLAPAEFLRLLHSNSRASEKKWVKSGNAASWECIYIYINKKFRQVWKYLRKSYETGIPDGNILLIARQISQTSWKYLTFFSPLILCFPFRKLYQEFTHKSFPIHTVWKFTCEERFHLDVIYLDEWNYFVAVWSSPLSRLKKKIFNFHKKPLKLLEN